ncbi:unnamed protein product [Hymenolepis diminuta]|uniref:Uncharacterized protein n=1 Tax=Hymenolepis diminuta TaxID=6216 RepID=A0A564ZBK0_HYMDI|nr:unnamed protein product [Hymenolepis diminuta]
MPPDVSNTSTAVAALNFSNNSIQFLVISASHKGPPTVTQVSTFSDDIKLHSLVRVNVKITNLIMEFFMTKVVSARIVSSFPHTCNNQSRNPVRLIVGQFKYVT